MDQSLLSLPPMEIEFNGSAVRVSEGTSRVDMVVSSGRASRNGPSLPMLSRTPRSFIAACPGVLSAQSNRKERRSNRNSGAGCTSDSRRAREALDMNNALTDIKKAGQRCRIEVLIRVARANATIITRRRGETKQISPVKSSSRKLGISAGCDSGQIPTAFIALFVWDSP